MTPTRNPSRLVPAIAVGAVTVAALAAVAGRFLAGAGL